MSNSTKNKIRLQAVAFLLVALPSFGLYVAVNSGATIAIWLLLALIAAAMILAAIVS
jgi:hypothetical protein